MGEQSTAVNKLFKRIEERKEAKLKRDSKLREEWLGREFELSMRDELFGMEKLRFRLDAYDPVACTVKMRPMWVNVQAGVLPVITTQSVFRDAIPWSTDTFWSVLGTGQLMPV